MEGEDTKRPEMIEQSSSDGQRLSETDTGASTTMSDADDFPETIDLAWIEPNDQLLMDDGEANVSHSSSEVPRAETRTYAIPERLEVSWSEPGDDRADDPDDEQAEDRPSRYHSA